jgi:aminoglycoside phosphotransferase (APT) family kinase protein
VGGGTVRVEGLRRLPGGASRETWAFDAIADDARVEHFVLRRDPPGHQVQTSRRDEYELLRAAHLAGVPVPRMRWCEDGSGPLGAPFFIMDFVAGETLARRLLRDAEYASARAALPEQLAGVLAKIHAIPVADLRFLSMPAGDEAPGAAELTRHEQLYRAITPEPHPALELALRWLAARVPTTTAPGLVHGDFRIGNVIFGSDGLRAVIDWELAHGGDPMEDLGWLCVRSWRFGSEPPVGGLCARERFFAAYERAGGVPVDPDRVRWWEVFGNLKWAVICLLQAKTFLDGAVKSVELASLGRRVAEMELELLDLMEA